MRTTSRGLVVWDLSTDTFSHTQLAANWDTIDAALSSPATQVTTLSAVPTSGNFAGRLVMLSAADSGFPAWTMIRYDGSTWRPVNALEIQPAVPTLGNWSGRVVILSAANGGFNQWSIIRYDGSTWQLVGGWSQINNGNGALNIQGVSTATDVYISDNTRGFVLSDRTNGNKYRIFISNGNLQSEVVT